jgi:hypothetical protein
VIAFGDFIVYGGNRVRCIAGFGIGTMNDGSVVSLAKTPEAITVEVINAQAVLCIRFETFEEVGGNIDHMGDVDLVSLISSPWV